MGQSRLSSSEKCWAAMAGSFVMFAVLSCLGFSFMLRNDPDTGLVLVTISGVGLFLLTCATFMKCKCRTTEHTPLEDPPPAYRPSWRRSFFRRLNRDTLPVSGGTRSETIRLTHSTTTPSSARSSPPPPYQATAPQEVKSNVPSASMSPPGLRGLQNAALYPDMDDPPHYEATLADKEEAKP